MYQDLGTCDPIYNYLPMNLRGDYGGLGCCALEVRGFGDDRGLALRAQVPDNHILSQILTYRYLLSATKVPYYLDPRVT